MNSTSLAAAHHGEIHGLQSVAGIRIFTSWHRPGLVLARHVHERACIGFVLDGRCEETLGFKVVHLGQNKMFFRPAREMHANRSGNNGFRCLIADVPEQWLEHVREYAAPPNQPLYVQNTEISSLGMKLYNEFRLGDSVSPIAIEGIMLEIAAGIFRWGIDRRERSPLWLRRSREALHAHYHESLPLKTLAGWAGIHPVHLAREFRKHYGCSIGQYIRRLRVESACHQLAESQSPPAMIALELGFANQAHFCRVFKSITGTSPARYRSSLKSR